MMKTRPRAAFGLSLLAALAATSISAMSASAVESGHFTSDALNGTKFHAVEATGGQHTTYLHAYGSTVSCHKVTYHVHHVNVQTFTGITVTPTYEQCTAGESAATVTMNGCHYTFTPRSSGHATPHFKCPEGAKAKVVTPNGTMQFGAQTPPSGGVTYTTNTNASGKHTITVNITAEGISGECHGLCQFLGTNTTTARLTGSVTVEGTDTKTGEPVNITAT